MKVYFGHSSDVDYKKLYQIIKDIRSDHDIILPHDFSKEPFDSKKMMDEIDVFIAEVSMPSTGLGIEIAWAKDSNTPIYFMYKKGSKISDCLTLMSKSFIEYTDENDFVEKFIDILSQQ